MLFRSAFCATSPAASITLGLEVLVQLVIAAITTSPSPMSWPRSATSTRFGLVLLYSLVRSPLNTSSTLPRLTRSCGRFGPASEGATDFSGLFIGFSFFLIAAALMLMALLFQFGIEQRAPEIGTLLALGFAPRVAQIGSDIPTVVGLVAAGMGCAFVPESLSALCPPTVQLVPLREVSDRFDVEFAFDENAATPVVARFAQALREVVGRGGRTRRAQSAR